MESSERTQIRGMTGALWWVALGPLLAVAACDRTTLLASSRLPDAGGQTPDAGEDAGLPISWDGGIAYCGGQICACSNGIDDDGDGFVDGWDSECTGPFDNDEASFATGLERPGNRQCLNCFFDDNAGGGRDDCQISAQCLADGTAQGAPAACNSCEPSDQCVAGCLSRTPNACDCFGCCVVEQEGQSTAILLTDTCSLRDVADESKCPRCMPSARCFNPCDTCEVCTGKPLAALPAVCAAQGGYVCEGGGQRCNEAMPCEASEYCSQGCCVPILY